MRFNFLLTLPLFLSTVLGADVVESAEKAEKNPINPLKVSVNVTFPDIDSPLKMTIFNRKLTKLNINLQNNEIGTLGLDLVGGALWDADHTKIVRNLSTVKIHHNKLEPAQSVIIPYTFTTDIYPQDVILELGLVATDPTGSKVSHTLFKGPLSVADPPTSIFDPQVLFLYLVLSAVFGGLGYFAYQTWVVPQLPKKKKVRAARPVTEAPVVTSSDASGKAYNEDWIPETHIKRPVARKVGGSMRGAKKVE